MYLFTDCNITNDLRKKSFNFFRNLFAIILIYLCLYANIIYAKDINIIDVKVVGNQRIETDTILSISRLDKGKIYSEEQINESLQLLNATTYFETVDLQINEKVLIIKVKENPTINTINFEGNSILKDENLIKLISTSERQTFSLSRIERDSEKIAEAYVSSGRISAQVSPKIIKRTDNRVDLVFEISEGRVTEIEKITFIGNRNFSETRLRGIIASKQTGLFRSLIKSDTFIKDRLEYDFQLLKEFYINRGFINFEIISSSVDMTRTKDAFLINIAIEEGQK